MRFAPSLPVKHAICPRHRSSCWLIECDRAIHTLLPIRHHLLWKGGYKRKKKNQHHSAVTGCQAEGTNLHRVLVERLPIWGREQRPRVTMGGGDAAPACTHLMVTHTGGSFPLCCSISDEAQLRRRSTPLTSSSVMSPRPPSLAAGVCTMQHGLHRSFVKGS